MWKTIEAIDGMDSSCEKLNCSSLVFIPKKGGAKVFKEF